MKTTQNIVRLIIFGIISICSIAATAQGVGIPAKNWGIGFGNSATFTGLRFNAVDHNIDKIKGVNFTSWYPKPFEGQSGSFYGLGIGVPLAIGTENRFGASIGILGVAATEKVYGLNIGGLAVGGDKVAGLNVGGFAVGGGEFAKGINIGGLAVGAGESVAGFNFGGLAVGAGKNLSGISLSLLAVGAGNDVVGINLAGLAVGAGNNVSGINIGGLAVGAGNNVTGLSVAILAVGAGGTLRGINLAGLAVAAPKVRGISFALLAGGTDVKGIVIAPAYFNLRGEFADQEPVMTGLSISAFNHIQGLQKGLTIGVFNYAWKVKGLQIGLINYNRNNPKGLRVLPVFNTNFRKKS